MLTALAFLTSYQHLLVLIITKSLPLIRVLNCMLLPDFVLKQNRNIRVLLMNQMWAFLCFEKICDVVAKKWMMNKANMGA